MTDRGEKKGASEQFDELFGTDAFLDELSRGVDPSGGADPLAELMLSLHHQVNAPIPAAPDLDDLLPEEASPVVSLDERRRRRSVSPWMSGLVGAAAATMLIAGAGGAVYNAQPDSPLWEAKTSMFGEHAAVVDLASALEEVDKRHAEGDVEGAMQVLEQARILANAVNSQDRASTQRAIQELEARIIEVPTTVTQAVPTTATSVETSVSITTSREPAEVLPPIVITETQTVTETVVRSTTISVSVTPSVVSPTPTASTSVEPTATVTPQP